MRLTLPAVALAATLLTVSSAGLSQRPDDQIDARSLLLTDQGRAALADGKYEAATDALETALTVDPRNRAAFLLLAETAKRQNLPGKAIRLYREALMLEPTDVAALAGQGEALVAKGAIVRAKENLAKVRTLCTRGCPEIAQLSAAIDKGPPVQSAQAAPAAVAPAKN